MIKGIFYKAINLSFIKAVSIILAFAITVIVSRIYGDLILGYYVQILAISNVSSAIFKFGLENTIIRELNLNTEDSREVSNIIKLPLLYGIAGLGLACLYIVLAYYNKDKAVFWYSGGIVLGFLMSGVALNAAILRSANRNSASLISQELIPQIVRMSFLVLFFLMSISIDVYRLIVVMYIGGVSAFIFSLYLVQWRKNILTIKGLDRHVIFDLVIRSKHYYQTSIFNQFSNGIDVIVLSLFLSVGQVALYGIYQRLINVVLTIATTIYASVLPDLVRLNKLGWREKYKKTYLWYSVVVGAGSLAYLFMLLTFYDPLMELWGMNAEAKSEFLISLSFVTLSCFLGPSAMRLVSKGKSFKLRNYTILNFLMMLIFLTIGASYEGVGGAILALGFGILFSRTSYILADKITG